MLRILPILLVAVLPVLTPGALAAVPAGNEQRAYLHESCIISDEPYFVEAGDDVQLERSLPLAGIVVGKLVNAFVNGAVKATAGGLDSISKHKDMHYLAANNVNLYRASLAVSPSYEINTQLACATVVVAEFANDNADCTDDYIPRKYSDNADEPREDDSVENVLRRANICVNGSARSIYEIRFSLSQDRTAYRLESAGVWVNGLLSTNREKATRSLIYTLDILEPAAESSGRILSTAWVNIGEVTPGMISDDPDHQVRSDWLLVPAMSSRATGVYDRDTAVHNDVHAEIQALERSVVRNRRLLDGINKRLDTAGDNAKEMLRSEADKVEFNMLRAESLLDAQRAEYNDLPQAELMYMPITVRLGIIESRNERRALNALASVMEVNSASIADSASESMGYERSADLLSTPVPSVLDQSRTEYFDALVIADEARQLDEGNIAEMEHRLADAREEYNIARSVAGIPEVE